METPRKVRYPDPWVEVIDESFTQYLAMNAAVECLYSGARWSEGPVWFGDGGYLLWSDIPNNRILRWDQETNDVSIFRKPSNFSNGNYRDSQGHLITCERKRVTRTEFNGQLTVLADNYQSQPLNAPNDLIAHADGSIWFTDPGYGSLSLYEGGQHETLELPTRVYRWDPKTQELEVMVENLEKPNGLCFSPDYSKLYVADTGASHKKGHPKQIWVYAIENSRTVGKGQVFFDMSPAFSDGFRCDIHGNIWTSAGWAGEGLDGVWVLNPEGNLIGKIHLPEVCANLCFGGPKGNRLFMAASSSIYALYTETRGVSLWDWEN